MPSTAPALTWQMTSIQPVVDPTSIQDVLDALALAVGLTADWEVKSSAAGELEIGPVGGATPNQRILFAFGINAAQRQEPHDSTTVDANEMWVGIAPDGGTLGDAHGSGDPYGAARWSLYWRCSDIVTNTNKSIDNMFCIASDESIGFWFRNASQEDWWGGLGGAILDPPTDDDGEGSPGRVYGLAVTGRTLISSGFWSNGNGLFASGSGGTNSTTGCFRPALPTRWTILDRSTPIGDADPRTETEGGSVMSTPVLMWQSGTTTLGTPGGANPNNAVGVLRQVRWRQDGHMRGVVIDSSAAVQSYLVGGASTNSLADVASFDNG